jgi:hypothetical protein
MVLIIAILNDGTIMTISKDRVKPSPTPDSWKLDEIFATGIVLGTYMAIVTAVFFYLAHDTNFFTVHLPIAIARSIVLALVATSLTQQPFHFHAI